MLVHYLYPATEREKQDMEVDAVPLDRRAAFDKTRPLRIRAKMRVLQRNSA
jgi:hypothetical protein